MSFKFVCKETKLDGWFFNEEVEDLDKKGIYSRDLDFWRRVFLNISCDADLYNPFQKATTKEERLKIIQKSINLEIESFKECLEYDLKHNIKIYPLIKRGVLNE